MKNIFLTALFFAAVLASCEKVKDRPDVNHAEYPLPGSNLYPEGIVYEWLTGNFFTGSTANGDILMVNVETKNVKMFASGSSQNRNAAVGMKLDKLRRLWVCGGSDNKIHVLNAFGELVKQWDTQALFGSGFVNDCVIDDSFVYFTDSYVRKIYRVNANNISAAQPEVWLQFTNDEILYEEGEFNLNGIESTGDNQYLIVVNSYTGKLYRIRKETKEIVEIVLNTPMTYGDGLYLLDHTLYVSRNALGQIYPVTLNEDYTAGTVGNPFGNNLLYNTTLAKAGDYFLVVNGQLNNAKPVLPFSVSRVEIPE